MRFQAIFRQNEQPVIVGCTKESKKVKWNSSSEDESSCHEFRMSEIEGQTKDMQDEVPLVAYKCPDGHLYGPASCKTTKSIMYTCSRFKCRIYCPCKICRCSGASHCQETNSTCSDCSSCKLDFADHTRFHKTMHMQCKFCRNFAMCIPIPTNLVAVQNGCYASYVTVYVSASLFRHGYGLTDPVKQDTGFQCDKCELSFLRKGDLKRHEKSQHFGAEISCTDCEEKFTREDNLRAHIKALHSGDKNAYQCPVCKVEFKKKFNYKRHFKGYKECNVCSRAFCSLKQVQDHQRNVHLQLSCEECKKSFSDLAHLNRHKQAFYISKDTPRYKCEQCSECFCTKTDFSIHIAEMHKKIYECSVCCKNFKSKLGFQMHCGKRDAQNCSECGKSFCSAHDLKLHSYLHIVYTSKI